MGRDRGQRDRQRRSLEAPPRKSVRGFPHRAALFLALIALAAGALWSLRGRFGGLEPKPLNVIVVTADTLRADKLACYGNPGIATPHLDRLALSGVLFENTTTVTPLTLPAHSSIFTGTYPMYHGVRDNGGYYLEPDQTTLAEVLKGHGYATGAFVSAFVLDSRWGLDQGFDRYFDDFDLSKFEQVSLDTVQRRGGETLEQAIAWLDSVRDQRFFSWIHFYDPHTPYDPPEPYRSRYKGVRWGLYDGEVAYVDSLVGRLMDWLDSTGLADKTILVFIGDHGESLGEHREITHGFFVYEATVAVPFILRTPYRQLEGRRVSSQVRTIDLMPTLLELLGFDVPEPVQGQSLVNLSRGRSAESGLVAYSESFYPRHHYGWSELRSLRNDRLHFIAAPRPELYDLQRDPHERNNLAENRSEEVRGFERQLEEILKSTSKEGVDERQPETLDPQTAAQLAALGYLGGTSKVRVDPAAPLADPKDKIELFNWIKQAGSDSSEGRIKEAFAKIRKVLEQDAGILEAHLILGNLYNKQGERQKAIEAYKQALARDPAYAAALYALATTYESLGRLEDAEAGFRRMLELDPRDNRALFMLARIDTGRKDFKGALELLQRATAQGSERPPTYNLMAECLIELQRLDEAETAVHKALELKDDLPTAHYNLALILEERGDLEGAIRAYKKEIEISPKDHKAHFNLAKLYGKTGRPGKMKEHFEASIEADPSFAEGHLYLAKLYLDAGDLARAARLAKKGIELGPEASMAPLGHYILADVYSRQGRLGDAEQELAIARRLQARSP